MSAPVPRASLRLPLEVPPARAGLGLILTLLALAGYAEAQAWQVPAAVVFVADGAGNFQVASRGLRQVAFEDGLPLEVRAFEWSHGYARILSDQMLLGHTREQGRRMAAEVCGFHAAHPETPISLYAHSAGCTVVVGALEALPPGLVERAVLLSPSISSRYDLGGALRGVKQGLHVFYSRHDWWYLGVCTTLLGTADRHGSRCGGRVGFDAAGPLEPELAVKLFQRPWQPEDRALGNNGGHFGHYQPAFVRAYIVPLLMP
jgi:hypothetical protein